MLLIKGKRITFDPRRVKDGIPNPVSGEIERMATESQVPITPDAVDYYEELVAGVIRRTPGGQARFQAGDLSVLSEAWGDVKTFLGQFQRPAQQQLIDTKQQVHRLPPRPSGGAPGQALPPKIGEDANQFQRDMHSRFEDLVRNSGGPAR